MVFNGFDKVGLVLKVGPGGPSKFTRFDRKNGPGTSPGILIPEIKISGAEFHIVSNDFHMFCADFHCFQSFSMFLQ